MLNLLEKHDPNSASYLASFAFALARIAYADSEVSHSERGEMRRILHELALLESSEVDFIMELSMMQKRAKSGMDNQLKEQFFDKDRGQHFLDSRYAIAQADGIVSAEEVVEIQAIAAEFGQKKRR
jgi:putative ABC transport system ATP-binding protein